MGLLRTQIGRKFQGTAGDVISGATAVVVSLPSSATATVYANETGTATIAQPLITGIDGGLSGWLEIGDYNITVTSPGGTVSSRYYSVHPQQSYLETYSGSDVPLTIKAGTAQTAPLAEFQNAGGTVVASITAAGSVTSPTITAIQGSVTNSQGSVTAIQGSVTATQGSVTNTQGSVTATQGSITPLAGSVTTLSGSVTALAGTVAGQEARVGAIEANNWVTTNRINDGAVTAAKLATDATAMNLLAGTVFTTPGTTSYTLPAKAEIVVIEFIGAGGGGGKGASMGGAGGSGGEWTRETYAASEFGTAALTVVVGAGGTSEQAGGWSRFGGVYWPGARPGVGTTQGARGIGIVYGNSGMGGGNASAGYRGFRGGGGGGGGGNSSGSSGAGGKGLDTPANIWPTLNTQSVTAATGGGPSGVGTATVGNNATASTGDGGGGGGGTLGGVGAAGGNGASPGGGGGGSGAGATSGPGGTGGNAQISIWVYG